MLRYITVSGFQTVGLEMWMYVVRLPSNRNPTRKAHAWFATRKLGKLELNSHANANATFQAVASTTGTLATVSLQSPMGGAPVSVAEAPGQISKLSLITPYLRTQVLPMASLIEMRKREGEEKKGRPF